MKLSFSINSLLVILLCAVSASSLAQTTSPLPKTIQAAVESPRRTESMRARDRYRHPVETLTFFGLEPQMTVVEIWPGSGWYAQILAPFLSEKGHYVGAVPSLSGTGEGAKQFKQWMDANPEIAKATKTVEFNPPGKVALGADNSADLVLTFRNLHNWMGKGAEGAAFKAFFKVLKPGGTLGVVEHRADAKSEFDAKAESGYVREADVIRFAEAAGFKLDKKSEINANPKDTKDYPEGVWTLPPVLTLKDKDREKYIAIGESDRMTLRFTKPASGKK